MFISPRSTLNSLRKSVNAGALEEVTDFGSLPGRAQPPLCLRCRPKAEHLKGPAAIADARSALENRTSALAFYCEGDNHHQRHGECQ